MSKFVFASALVAAAIATASASSCAGNVPTDQWPENAQAFVDMGGCAMVPTAIGAGISCSTDLAGDDMAQSMNPGVTGMLCDFCCETCAENGQVCPGGDDHTDDHTDDHDDHGDDDHDDMAKPCLLENVVALIQCGAHTDKETCTATTVAAMSDECQSCISTNGPNAMKACVNPTTCSAGDMQLMMSCASVDHDNTTHDDHGDECTGNVPTDQWPENAQAFVNMGGCAMVPTAIGAGISCSTDLAGDDMAQSMNPGVTGMLCDFCCETCAEHGQVCPGGDEDHGTVEPHHRVLLGTSEEIQECQKNLMYQLSGECLVCTAQNQNKQNQGEDMVEHCFINEDSSCNMESACAFDCSASPKNCEEFESMVGDCARSCEPCFKNYMAKTLGCDADYTDDPLNAHCIPALWEAGCKDAGACYDPAVCGGNIEDECVQCAQAIGMCDECFPAGQGEEDTTATEETGDTAADDTTATEETGDADADDTTATEETGDADADDTTVTEETGDSDATDGNGGAKELPVVSSAVTVSAALASVAAAVSVFLF